MKKEVIFGIAGMLIGSYLTVVLSKFPGVFSFLEGFSFSFGILGIVLVLLVEKRKS